MSSSDPAAPVPVPEKGPFTRLFDRGEGPGPSESVAAKRDTQLKPKADEDDDAIPSCFPGCGCE